MHKSIQAIKPDSEDILLFHNLVAAVDVDTRGEGAEGAFVADTSEVVDGIVG